MTFIRAAFAVLSLLVPITGSARDYPGDQTGRATHRSDSSGRIVAVYAIQVGAFSVPANAEKLVNLLKSKGFNAVIYDNLIDGKHLLYLVWVGRYDRQEDAVPELKRIEDLTGIRGVLREQMIWRRW